MLRFSPILLALIYGLVMYKFSAWRTAKTLDQQSVTLMDPALSPLLQRMAKALDIPKLNVQIYEIDPINGLAAPDGRIFITRGFYNKYKAGDVSGEELASVIAHELGHVALGHARRRMIDFSGQNAVRAALGMVLGRVLPGIGPWIAGLVANLLMARLSRGDEYEADEYAAALMVKSGLGTDAQKTLFLKLEELTGQIGSLPAWLMSHPKTADRIAAIETLEQKWGLG
ncbi:Metalloprotease LoiP precursor [Rhodobacteraceae bacterium SB2]|jgi:putative metalloprotease|nr:peptidase M48 [Marinovum sp.]MBT3650124.1 M48 family metallopeptidase [Paracoccaceae bacterium]OAH05971.1 Metalloprotease LoiP precursor [Rhodobacteraceae bacterium SB2]WQC62144.1 M48 family metallopeptidase [Alphaproteobacteria bacterium US3C007]MBF21104.1 peptidase M48 [Marinovum sp.]|tara:strand:+ start:696 stop:1379 length:684 start_codon:yes stop_codon:yes gene_type:complete